MRKKQSYRTACANQSAGRRTGHRLTPGRHQNAASRPAGPRLGQPIIQGIDIDTRIGGRLQRQRHLPSAGISRGIGTFSIEVIDRYRPAGRPRSHLRGIRKQRFRDNGTRICGRCALRRHVPSCRIVTRDDLAGAKPETGERRHTGHDTPRAAASLIFKK